MPRVAKKIICPEEDHMELLKIVRSKKRTALGSESADGSWLHCRQIHKGHCYAAK